MKQDLSVCLPQIKHRMPVSLVLVKSCHPRKCFVKLCDHIIAYFVTVPADGGPDHSKNIFRSGTKFLVHPFYHLLPHRANSSPPSGMSISHRFLYRIIKNKRHTVCKKCHQHYPRLIGYQSVNLTNSTIWIAVNITGIFFPDTQNIGFVHLLG